MESNSLRGLFGVFSPLPVEQRVAPQPTEPIENEIPFEFPSSMMERLLANPFTRDGTKHPPLHGAAELRGRGTSASIVFAEYGERL